MLIEKSAGPISMLFNKLYYNRAFRAIPWIACMIGMVIYYFDCIPRLWKCIVLFFILVPLVVLCWISIWVNSTIGRNAFRQDFGESPPEKAIDISGVPTGSPAAKIVCPNYKKLIFSVTVLDDKAHRIQIIGQKTFQKDIRLDSWIEPGASKTYIVDISNMLIGMLTVSPGGIESSVKLFNVRASHRVW